MQEITLGMEKKVSRYRSPMQKKIAIILYSRPDIGPLHPFEYSMGRRSRTRRHGGSLGQDCWRKCLSLSDWWPCLLECLGRILFLNIDTGLITATWLILRAAGQGKPATQGKLAPRSLPEPPPRALQMSESGTAPFIHSMNPFLSPTARHRRRNVTSFKSRPDALKNAVACLNELDDNHLTSHVIVMLYVRS